MFIDKSRYVFNIINIANMLGYKVKPISPAYTNISISQTVAADETDLEDKVEERTKGDAIRAGCKDDYTGSILYVVKTEELPTARKI